MGLGALYLLHVLAQDYMKIRKPAARLATFLLSKRDLNAVDTELAEHEVQFCCIVPTNEVKFNFPHHPIKSEWEILSIYVLGMIFEIIHTKKKKVQ